MLDSISIKNFKAIRSEEGLTLKGLDRVNYLVGENGSGKSSIFEYLYVNFLEKKFDIKMASKTTFDKYAIAYKLFKPPLTEHIFTDFDNLNIYDINLVYPKLSRVLYEYMRIIDDPTEYETTYNGIWQSNLLFTELFYESWVELFYIHDYYDEPNLIKLTIDENKLLPEVFDLMKIFNIPDYLKHMSQVPTADWKLYYGTFGNKAKNSKSSRLYRDKHFKDYGSFFMFHNVSAGLQAIFQMCITILHSYLSKSRIFRDLHLNKEFVFLIEEPETNLHPTYQKLLPILFNNIVKKYPDIQLFISTHSPFIISGATGLENQKVYLIKDGQTTDKAGNLGKRTEGFDSRDPSYLGVVSKMLGAGLDDIDKPLTKADKNIKSRRIIYCEGELDSQIYSLLFPTEGNIINIFIPCGGAQEVLINCTKGVQVNEISFGKNTETWCLIDRSYSRDALVFGEHKIKHDKGDMFLDQDRKLFLEYSKNHKMLKRRELENYLYDPEILKIALDKNIITKESLDKVENIDIISTNVKDLLNNLNDRNKLELAKLIDSKKQIYKELHDCVFNS